MSEQLQITPEQSAFGDAASFEHTQRVALMIAKSEIVPKAYQNNVQNVMVALEMANRIGISPLMVMQNLHVIQGKPSFGSPFIIATINSSKRFSPLRFEVTGTGMGMSCYAWANDLTDNTRVKGPTITMEMAKAEGWIDKAGSKWKTMPELMIQYRAASFFGRLNVPEIMMGMHSVEEIEDISYTEVKVDKVAERLKLLINDCMTIEAVDTLQIQITKDNPEVDVELFNSRKMEIKSWS